MGKNQYTGGMSQYETDRNKLIPAAEKYADVMAGIQPADAKRQKGKSSTELEEWRNKWNFSFHSRMTQLWIERLKKEEI